jgi:TPR repeat protein
MADNSRMRMLAKTLAGTAAAALALGAAINAAPAQEAPAHLCDTLAANPLDIARKAPGVETANIKGEEARAACQDALTRYPEEARFQFQLARALRALNLNEDAVFWYRKAADRGYPGAQNSLGVMYMQGLGVKADCGEAVRWYAKAAAQGYEPAKSNLESARCLSRAGA